MMHAKEEVITLLDGQHAPVPTPSQARRKKALRVLLGVAGASVLVVGSVVAVEMIGAKNDGAASPVGVMTLDTQRGSEPAPSSMEADFGWDSINNGWCSARAAAWCLFKSDKEQCKKDIHESCDSKPEVEEAPAPDSAGGNGSGSGTGAIAGFNQTVGTNHTMGTGAIAGFNQTAGANHTMGTNSTSRTNYSGPSAGDPITMTATPLTTTSAPVPTTKAPAMTAPTPKPKATDNTL